MREKSWPKGSLFFLLFVLFLLFLLLLNAPVAMDGVRHGLSLVCETLLPSLFPFLVFSELLVRLDAGRLFSVILGKPCRSFRAERRRNGGLFSRRIVRISGGYRLCADAIPQK